ncbi:MAG: recombinase family protein [Actinomycetota bacterium]|nr:recombinase family protein [Actinomycetota bacterium]
MPASAATNEPSSSSTRTAYGYIRMENPDEIEIALQHKEIGTFCAAQGPTLGAVFVDRGVQGDVTIRLGFTALVDVLCFPDSSAVVVPTLTHLSERSGVRRVLTSRIQGTASRLPAVYGEEER